MKLPTPKDLEFLNKIRLKLDCYPFSYKYNTNLNSQLFKEAKSNGVSEDTLNLINLGDFFYNNFHKKFSNELISLHEQINLTNADLNELFITYLNLQESANKTQYSKFLSTVEEFTAFNFRNAVEIREDLPDNPQNFIALSEALVECGNVFLRYLAYSKVKYEAKKDKTPEDRIFNLLENIIGLTNKYYVIKDHYDGCLYLDGKIELVDTNKIYFDSCVNNLHLINQISTTAIENQRLLRYEYYDSMNKNDKLVGKKILKNSSLRILSRTTISENGFIKYELRSRNLKDYDAYLEYQVSVHDYYPFYSITPLARYNNLTISELIRLHAELKILVIDLYVKISPELYVRDMKKFKKHFLPKIRHSVLKSYLTSVTLCNTSQVEVFIKLMTTKNTGQLNLYSTHLLKRDDYYYFLYFPLIHSNYLFLIDYWLEQADEDLSKRGKALEEYIKRKLRVVNEKKYNIFTLIDKTMFKVTDNLKEEIDILIQTKNTLIIGEIKCIKYPMYERDRFKILTDDLTTAVDQLNRKGRFLVYNQNHFKDIYSVHGKKIIKVIILNYPSFTGITANDIPITDANLFLSYFQSGKLVERRFNEHDTEDFSTTSYYSNEEEFCNNFESYLQENPLNKIYSEQLSKKKCSYKMDDYEIIFEDINTIDKKNILKSINK